MCKQKPLPASAAASRDDRRTGEISQPISPSGVVVVVNGNGAGQSSSSDVMPSVGACYRAPPDKMLSLPQERMTSTVAEVTAADPWSPDIVSGAVPDPRCPRRLDELRQKEESEAEDTDIESLPCGSEESLLPRNNSPCFSYAPSSLAADVVTTTSTSINSYPFSSTSAEEPHGEEMDLICFSPAFSMVQSTTKGASFENVLRPKGAERTNRIGRVNWQEPICGGDDEDSDSCTEEESNNDQLLPPVFFGGVSQVPTVPVSSYARGVASSAGSSGPQSSVDATDSILEMFFVKRLGLPQVRSAAEISVASSTLSQKSMPICRICHLPATEDEQLISPCRCSGTMRFIHTTCLMKWLEISSTRSKRPPSCELCLYQYHRHKKFKVSHWQFPQCSRQDKFLHVIFIVSLVVMVGCATATILCFKQDRGVRHLPEKTELTRSEVITLVCGVLFFVAFFVAMYVEVKSRNTIYRLCVKFIYLNQQWYIDEYDKRKDVQPVPV